MLVSTIVLIILRLFSIQFLLDGISMLAASPVEFWAFSDQHNDAAVVAKAVVMALVMILFSAITWFAAPWLSQIIPEKQDASVQIPSLSLRDLYAFAFIFLGLYFTLSSLGNTLTGLYYAFFTALSHTSFDPRRKQSLYNLSRPLITMVGGFICLFCARRFADKLAGEKTEISVPAEKPIP